MSKIGEMAVILRKTERFMSQEKVTVIEEYEDCFVVESLDGETGTVEKDNLGF